MLILRALILPTALAARKGLYIRMHTCRMHVYLQLQCMAVSSCRTGEGTGDVGDSTVMARSRGAEKTVGGRCVGVCS